MGDIRGIVGADALAEYMRNKGGGSATVVHLMGCTPGSKNAHCLGTYARQQQMCEGRCLYQSTADASLSLWWAPSGAEDSMGDPLPGSWYCGPTNMVGTRQGFMRATQNTDVAEEVTATWQVYFDGKMNDAPDVRVMSDKEYASALASSLAGAARLLVMSGRTPDGLDCFSAFGFSKLKLSTGAGGVGEVVNDRYAYRSSDDTMAMWHIASPPTWMCGSASDCGTRSGFLVAEDAALLPENITATWKMFEENAWHDTMLKVVAQEGLMEA